MPSGLFASGNIVSQEVPAALVVPTAAVRTDSAGTFVLVIENGRLARRPITAGVRDESKDKVQILSGLTAGEMVAASGGYLIDSESQLRYVPGGPAAAPALAPRSASRPVPRGC